MKVLYESILHDLDDNNAFDDSSVLDVHDCDITLIKDSDHANSDIIDSEIVTLLVVKQ